MPKKKTGREIVERFHRQLEREYGIRIDKRGEFDAWRFNKRDRTTGHFLPSEFDRNISDALEVLQKTIATLPALPTPERIARARQSKIRTHAPS